MCIRGWHLVVNLVTKKQRYCNMIIKINNICFVQIVCLHREVLHYLGWLCSGTTLSSV